MDAINIDCIWWRAHQKALGYYSAANRMRIHKFLNDYLHTGKRAQKYYKHKTALCAVCSISIEDEDHILRCPTYSRRQIRETWLEELNIYLSRPHTPPYVKELIIMGVSNWLTRQTTKLQRELPDPELRNALMQQETIGWRHFVRGRLAAKWGVLVKRHLSTMKTSKGYTSEKWGIQLIKLCWTYVLRMWDCRNKEVHGATKDEQQQKKKQDMIAEMKMIQSDNRDLPESSTQLINVSENTMATMPNPHLEQY
jgi:hypothetical protein